jgi:hypothetical protein
MIVVGDACQFERAQLLHEQARNFRMLSFQSFLCYIVDSGMQK